MNLDKIIPQTCQTLIVFHAVFIVHSSKVAHAVYICFALKSWKESLLLFTYLIYVKGYIRNMKVQKKNNPKQFFAKFKKSVEYPQEF